MARIEKKRQLDLASFRAKKRRKIELENDNSLEDPHGRAVGLDRLPWNQVPVGRLEDAEGFFGLEELSDVDVVRDPIFGKVEYKVWKKPFTYNVVQYIDRSSQLLSNQSVARRIKEPEALANDIGIEDQEWEGFGEEQSEKHVGPSIFKGKSLVENDSRKSEKRRREQDKKKKERAASTPKRSKNTFEVLGTADEGEETADREQCDSKQNRMTEDYFCPLLF